MYLRMSAFKIFLAAIMLTSLSAFAGTTAQTFTLDGQLYTTGTTTPLLDATAIIKVQILDPSLTCLLYEQQHTVDTLSSNGYFNVEVGSDTGALPPRTGLDPGRTMLQVYQNTSPITAANAPSQTCAGGIYTPANGDKRIVRVIVIPTLTGTEDPLSPDIVMNSMPMAKVAESIQGIVPASLLQVNTAGGVALSQVNLEAMFTGAAYTNLQAVMAGGAGTATSVSASAGTVGAPSISFSGDADTGLYSVGANQIGVTTGGVQRFIVDASGISSGTTGGGVLTSAAGTAALPALSFAGDLDTGWWRPAANTMAASTGGAEQMRITSAGYVGIANTAPGSELDVKGTLRLTGATSGYLGLRAPATVTTPVTFTLPNGDGTAGQVLKTDGSGILSWDAAGGAASTTGLGLGTVTAPSISFSGDLNTGIWSPAAETIAISTTGAERFRINPSGFVGIGTTDPKEALDLGDAAPSITMGSNSAIMGNLYYDTGWKYRADGYGGFIKFNNAANGGGLDIGMTAANNASGAGAVATPAAVMTVLPSGNVGIGTTNPAQKLDVTGDIQTSGCLYYASSSLGACASDERIKKDIHSYDVGLEALLEINPVKFKYNGLAGFRDNGKEQLGVIAQDIEKADPSLVQKRMVQMHEGDQQKTEIKAVDYGAFTYVIINAIKEFYRQWEDDSNVLHTENARLKQENVAIKQENAVIRQESVAIKTWICSKDPGAEICQ